MLHPDDIIEIEKNQMSQFLPSINGIPITESIEELDPTMLLIEDALNEEEIMDIEPDDSLIIRIDNIFKYDKEQLSIAQLNEIRSMLLEHKLATMGTAYPTWDYHYVGYYSGASLWLPNGYEVHTQKTDELWKSKGNEYYWKKIVLRKKIEQTVAQEHILQVLEAIPYLGYYFREFKDYIYKLWTDLESPMYPIFSFKNTMPNQLIYYNFDLILKELACFKELLLEEAPSIYQAPIPTDDSNWIPERPMQPPAYLFSEGMEALFNTQRYQEHQALVNWEWQYGDKNIYTDEFGNTISRDQFGRLYINGVLQS